MTSYYITISSEPSYQLFKLTDECSCYGDMDVRLSINLIYSNHYYPTFKRYYSIKERIDFLNNGNLFAYTYIGPVSDPLDFPKLYPEYFI